MVLIQVKPEDKEKTFKILLNHGKFFGLSDNRFNITENVEEALKEIGNNGIDLIKEEAKK